MANRQSTSLTKPHINRGGSYSELLKHPLWQEKRLRILEAAGFECSNCGGKDDTLHVHHSYYERGLKPWDYPDDSLHCLCEPCHEKAQVAMTELHREIGRMSLEQVEVLTGAARAIRAIEGGPMPITVDSWGVAAGVARVFSTNAEFVISRLSEANTIVNVMEFFDAIEARRIFKTRGD